MATAHFVIAPQVCCVMCAETLSGLVPVSPLVALPHNSADYLLVIGSVSLCFLTVSPSQCAVAIINIQTGYQTCNP